MAQYINLYDPALRKKRDWLALGNVVAAGALLVALVGGLGVLTHRDLPELKAQQTGNETQLKALRDQLTSLGQQLAQRKPDPALKNDLDVGRKLLAGRSEILSMLKKRMDPDAGMYAEYLRGFARQSVTGLWLTGFSFENGSGNMEITGRTLDPALLPEYIKRLNREPAFQGRAFAALMLAEGKAEGKSEAAAPGQTAAKAPEPVPATAAMSAKAPYHEFRLIPRKPAGSSAAGGSEGKAG